MNTTTDCGRRPVDHLSPSKIPTVTRRGALAGLAALPAVAVPGSVLAASCEPAEPVHPWVRARELADELALVLAEVDGGSWAAHILPAGSDDRPIFFEHLRFASERPAVRFAEHLAARAK